MVPVGDLQDEDIPLATPILDDQAPERAGAVPHLPTYQKAVEELESSQAPAAGAVKSRLQLLHSVLQVGTPSFLPSLHTPIHRILR